VATYNLSTDLSVFTSGSETLRLSDIAEDINDSGRFRSTRQQLAQLDVATQGDEMKKLGACPDVIVGSVHAVTEDGHAVAGSFTGSQLGPYAAGAGKVIWVVGAQKVSAISIPLCAACAPTAIRGRTTVFALPTASPALSTRS